LALLLYFFQILIFLYSQVLEIDFLVIKSIFFGESGLVTGYELNSTFYTPLLRLVTGCYGLSQLIPWQAVTTQDNPWHPVTGMLHISEHNCMWIDVLHENNKPYKKNVLAMPDHTLGGPWGWLEVEKYKKKFCRRSNPF
jgi:hypothetical protein